MRMAFFLPSYFQKRLLRYALSRLDLLDTEALDLNNLGITIGQRSVIELKNVGVKIEKVIGMLNLPSTLVPKNASVRVLRVTIPADLHVSSIEVEIDGVDIGVDVCHLEARANVGGFKAREVQGPSHRDIANRPRTATNTLHDPGGLVASTLLPTSEDLAASFLETESEQKKQELKAAVISRSIHLQQSNINFDHSLSDDGTGMPEGFSLPGFVATFFAGIADRLSVTIKHVTVTISIPNEDDRSIIAGMKMILKVEELGLESLRLPKESDSTLDTRRSIQLTGLELLIACDGETLARKSTVSSPKLSKSRSTASATSHTGLYELFQASQFKQTSSFSANHSTSTSSITSSQAAKLELGVHESILDSSQIFSSRFPPSKPASSAGSPELSRLSPIASQQNPTHEEVSGSPSSESSYQYQTQDHGMDDLSQSKVFSRDEAESMFMSAVSNVRSSPERMPGGFDIPSPANFSEESIASTQYENMPTSEPTQQVPTISKDPLDMSKNDDGISVDKYAPEYLDPPDQVVKRVLRVNEITLKLPFKNMPNAIPPPEQTVFYRQPIQRGQVLSSSRVMGSTPHVLTEAQSVYGIPQDQYVQLGKSDCYEATIGNIEFVVDITLCRLITNITARISRILDQAPGNLPTNPSPGQGDLSLKLAIQSVVLNLMEHVPDMSSLSQQRVPTESTFDLHHDQPAVLQLQTLSVRLELAIKNGKLDQKLSIHRLGLSREAEKIISFFDPSSLQESFVGSSVVMEPDDLVLRQVDNRIDISVKPMRIMLDLLVLDDILSRSGGLSSLLDLGSSIASKGAAKDKQPSATPARSRQRSVRFNDLNSRTQVTHEEANALKLNLRISGAIVDLIGSESSMQVKSSAVKLIYRTDRLRTNISSISIQGPLIAKTPPVEIAVLRISDVELIYLNTPLEEDLDRLLGVLAPSSDKFEQDDDIMVDTLLRQRRKGGVVRLSIKDVQLSTAGLAWTHRIKKLGEEISKLSTVTKYLPEDDRPGILTFLMVSRFDARLELDKEFGPLILRTNLLECAHISVPSLIAAHISSFNLSRGKSEFILRELIPNMQESTIMGPPMLMCRFIADEMEPTVKLKLANTCFDYSVPLLLAVTQLGHSLVAGLAQELKPLSRQTSDISTAYSEPSDFTRNINLSLALRNAGISLKPIDSISCGLFLITDAVVGYGTKHHTALASFEIRKASIMVIDDIAKVGHEATGADPRLYFDQNDQIQELAKSGFVPIGSVSAAFAEGGTWSK